MPNAPKTHQQPIDSNKKPKEIEYILLGNKTHKIPKGKTGIVLDTQRDPNGPHPKGQSMVTEKEKTTIDTNHTPFKENVKGTLYLQENSHTNIALKNLPLDY